VKVGIDHSRQQLKVEFSLVGGTAHLAPSLFSQCGFNADST